jgi:hypothetical protein
MFGHKFCSLGDMISDERSFRLTTKIELVEVRELTESTDWFLPFHLLHPFLCLMEHEQQPGIPSSGRRRKRT